MPCVSYLLEVFVQSLVYNILALYTARYEQGCEVSNSYCSLASAFGRYNRHLIKTPCLQGVDSFGYGRAS